MAVILRAAVTAAVLGCVLAGCSPTVNGAGSLAAPGPDPNLKAVTPVSRLLGDADVAGATTGACTGAINDTSGKPLPSVSVELKRADAPQYDGPVARTNEKGEYGFAKVPVGQFTIGVRDGNAVRTQALLVVPGSVTRVDVGVTKPADEVIGVPGFGEIARCLPPVGATATYRRTSSADPAAQDTVTVHYDSVNSAEGLLQFTRTVGATATKVIQSYRADTEQVVLVRENLGDVRLDYKPGLPIYSKAAAGTIVPANVEIVSTLKDDPLAGTFRSMLTVQAAKELTPPAGKYPALGFQSYLTQLGSPTPNIRVVTSWFAEGLWLVTVEATNSDGSGKTGEVTVKDELASFAKGS